MSLVLLRALAQILPGQKKNLPKSKVVSQQLHDQSRILVRLLAVRIISLPSDKAAIGVLRKGIELGDGIVKCLLGKMASTIWGVKNLVVED